MDPGPVSSIDFVSHTTSSITIGWRHPAADAPGAPSYDNGAPITNYRVYYTRMDTGVESAPIVPEARWRFFFLFAPVQYFLS